MCIILCINSESQGQTVEMTIQTKATNTTTTIQMRKTAAAATTSQLNIPPSLPWNKVQGDINLLYTVCKVVYKPEARVK